MIFFPYQILLRRLSSDYGETVSFLAEYEDGATIAYPYTEIETDPMGDALHLSPGLALQPGDFVKLVNGALLFDSAQQNRLLREGV